MATENDNSDTDLAKTLERAYREFHADPRPISYWEIADRYDTDSLGEADVVADTIDLACRDAERDHPARDTDDLLETISEWFDE